MSVKLVGKNKPCDIAIYDMEDGQIGQITEWGQDTHHISLIVQRFGCRLIVVGQESGAHFSGVLGVIENYMLTSNYRVRLLKSGEQIEIVDN